MPENCSFSEDEIITLLQDKSYKLSQDEGENLMTKCIQSMLLVKLLHEKCHINFTYESVSHALMTTETAKYILSQKDIGSRWEIVCNSIEMINMVISNKRPIKLSHLFPLSDFPTLLAMDVNINKDKIVREFIDAAFLYEDIESCKYLIKHHKEEFCSLIDTNIPIKCADFFEFLLKEFPKTPFVFDMTV